MKVQLFIPFLLVWILTAEVDAMQLESSAFKEGGKIPVKYTCEGEDVNPPLTIRDIPPGAKSLVLIVDDPDVPEWVRPDKMWVHWVVFNLDPRTTEIKENAGRLAMMGKNTGGKVGYMGPCPPDREHRYFFKVYALDLPLSVREGVTKEQLEKEMQGHILDKASLMGRYEKTLYQS